MLRAIIDRLKRLRAHLADDRRRFGTGYVVSGALKDLFDYALVHPLELHQMRIEMERAELGPALAAYHRHTPAANRRRFTEFAWEESGDEWSPSDQWKATFIKGVLHPNVPEGGNVMEIGPGGARWSFELKKRADSLVLVDVTQHVLDICRAKLGDEGVTYVLSPGGAFPGVPDESIDTIWSYDVFVHIAPVEIARYVPEIARVLRPGGSALIHHSGKPRHILRRGWRSPMGGDLFARLAREHGLEVERQFDTWEGGGEAGMEDVFTVLRRPAGAPAALAEGAESALG